MLRSSILCSRGHFAFVHDLRFTRFASTTIEVHAAPARAQQRFVVACIGRYVLWNSLFPNANIACMEHDAHMHVDTPDSCLHSTAALRGVHRYASHSIYVGTGHHGWMWAGAQRSTLVLGPPRSGKTSSLVIPNILLSDGPVVSTSTKPDVMRATATSRSCDGWAFLYDPSGEVECPRDVERVGWSPLTTATSWDAAVVTADAMVGASRLIASRSGEHHWTERAGALLSTLLHAAALEGLSMPDVLRWIDRHDGAPALEILAAGAGEDAPATDLLAGIVATDPREQSGIWSTASGVLAAYRTQGALASTRLPPLDFEAFCDGPNTLYICSTGRRQRQFAPLVVATDRRRPRRRLRPGPRRARRTTRRCSPSTRWPTSPRSPTSPPWSARGPGRGCSCWPASRTSPRPGAAGVRRRTGSSRSSAPPWSCAGSPTPRRCATSAHWPGTGRWRRRRSAGRSAAGAASAPPRRSGAAREARLPVDAVARGAPGRALVLGPHKDVQEVALTPAHDALAVARAGAPGARARARRPARTAAAERQRPKPCSIAAASRRPSRDRAASSWRVMRRWSARRRAGSDARPEGEAPGPERLGGAIDAPAGPVRVDRRRRVHPHLVIEPDRRVGARARAGGAWPARPSAAGGAARPPRPRRPAPSASTSRSREAAAMPSRAAEPNAATTSRRWAPPWASARARRRSGARRTARGPGRSPARPVRAPAPAGLRGHAPAGPTPRRARR